MSRRLISKVSEEFQKFIDAMLPTEALAAGLVLAAKNGVVTHFLAVRV
jgi:hypothetical protein